MTNFDKSNIYTFTCNGKKIVLKPVKPRHISDSKKTKTITTHASKKPLHLLNKAQFHTESHKEGIVYVIIAISETANAPLESAPEFRQILTDFSDIMPNELPAELSPLRDIHMLSSLC